MGPRQRRHNAPHVPQVGAKRGAEPNFGELTACPPRARLCSLSDMVLEAGPTVDTPPRASPVFEPYRHAYEARRPDLTRKGHDDELADLSGEADVLSLTVAPSAGFERAATPHTRQTRGGATYLWLVRTDNVLIALEEGASGRATKRKRLAHTNLSGGLPAHAGGELWYRDERSLWLTGGSSRYAPRSREELMKIVESFRKSGYAVCTCGWDEEVARPARYFRGAEPWLEV